MSGRVGVEQTPDIKAVLEAHHWTGRGCSCNCWPAVSTAMEDWEGFMFPHQDAHRAHVAQALAPVLAAAVREARAAELREVADEQEAMCDTYRDQSLPGLRNRRSWIDWLRDRADRIAVDAPKGGA